MVSSLRQRRQFAPAVAGRVVDFVCRDRDFVDSSAVDSMVYAGDVEEGQRAVAPFRALATPLADFLRPMPYAEMFMHDLQPMQRS